MAYAKRTWKDAPDTSTPINAANLNHMENGIAEADVNAQNALDRLDDVDDEITQINSELSDILPQKNSCTFNSGIGATNYFSKLVKIKNIVFVMCQFRLGNSVGANTNIYTLPNGFAPKNFDKIALFSIDNTTQMKVTTDGHLALGATQQPNEYTCIGFYHLD